MGYRRVEPRPVRVMKRGAIRERVASCVPVPAGSFVRRVALTPHYDGVIRSHNEPVVIAICGIGPVNFTLSDPSTPPWREV